jgi:hypothetical protein
MKNAWIIAIPLSLVCLVSSVGAQKPKPPAPAEKPTLTAAQILDRSQAAMGGSAAMAKIKSQTARGTLTVSANNLTGTFEIKAKNPNKFVMTQNISGIGASATGFDGKVGWSKDPIQGLRTLAGAELRQLREQAQLQSNPASWKTLYTKQEVLGFSTVGGAKAYRVRVTPKEGDPQVLYYDAKTFLLVRIDATVAAPTGKVPVESYLTNYKTIDGVKNAMTMRQVVMGTAEVILTTTETKNNVAIPDSVFAKPAGDDAKKPAKM